MQSNAEKGVAISNRRLIKADAGAVTFKVKDYRRTGPERYTTMTLGNHEFIRRFLIHVLPKGLHRIRHYGLFASSAKAENLRLIRDLLDATVPVDNAAEQGDGKEASPPDDATAQPCPCCGGVMRIIEIFEAGCTPCHAAMPGHLVTSEGIMSNPVFDSPINRQPPRCNGWLRPRQSPLYERSLAVAPYRPNKSVHLRRNITRGCSATQHTRPQAPDRNAQSP